MSNLTNHKIYNSFLPSSVGQTPTPRTYAYAYINSVRPEHNLCVYYTSPKGIVKFLKRGLYMIGCRCVCYVHVSAVVVLVRYMHSVISGSSLLRDSRIILAELDSVHRSSTITLHLPGPVRTCASVSLLHCAHTAYGEHAVVGPKTFSHAPTRSLVWFRCTRRTCHTRSPDPRTDKLEKTNVSANKYLRVPFIHRRK